MQPAPPVQLGSWFRAGEGTLILLHPGPQVKLKYIPSLTQRVQPNRLGGMPLTRAVSRLRALVLVTPQQQPPAVLLQPLTPELAASSSHHRRTIVDLPLLAKLYQTRDVKPHTILTREVQSSALPSVEEAQYHEARKRNRRPRKSCLLHLEQQAFRSNSYSHQSIRVSRSLGHSPQQPHRLAPTSRLPRGMLSWACSQAEVCSFTMTLQSCSSAAQQSTSSISFPETWTSFRTTYPLTAADIQPDVTDDWPYPRDLCNNATIQIVHKKNSTWRRASGDASRVWRIYFRGPRKSASSWARQPVHPTRGKLFSRSLGDLWESRIDDAAGPWRNAVGGFFPRSKMKGRVFFCGVACLKEGWKEHKTMHAWRKA
ncbi:hypothetical protein C8F04DRAFT_1237617 [Mycena alexandri]|uniref:Uncharacterized protein n=1 Tax=Mycena alexandri TaxID=1745969 RepID=A0AAD6WYP8_9AGAR|nr:hypothetical protein C8F04DRAFT_1237617 [Mycena alexandri]